VNRQYYTKADCCLLVYDVTRKKTFKAIENYYIKEINNYCKKNIHVCLVGNKTDLKKREKYLVKKEQLLLLNIILFLKKLLVNLIQMLLMLLKLLLQRLIHIC
jgi:GTPase SAR1 family protein